VIKLLFSGTMRKVEIRSLGPDPLLEFSICQKNYTKPGAEATFTWVRVTVFKPPQWLVDKAKNDAFCSGIGDFSLRSYEKDGVKRQSAEVRVSSFDFSIADSGTPAPSVERAQTTAPRPATPVPDPSDEPPF